jgi:hypothetical protein
MCAVMPPGLQTLEFPSNVRAVDAKEEESVGNNA